MDPQRIETALSLYSSGLSAIVLLVDAGSFDGFTGCTKDFVDVCQQTTEFHFSSIDNQMEAIKNQVKAAVDWRSKKLKANTTNNQVRPIVVDKFFDIAQVRHLLIF